MDQVTTADRHVALRQRMASYAADYARDGVVHVPGALDAESLALARSLFDWSRAHPSPAAWTADLHGDGKTFYVDTHSHGVRDHYVERLRGSVFPEIAAGVLGVDRLWFLGEQLFVKKGESGSRISPWHQDSADLRIEEDVGAIGIWMAFEELTAETCLRFVRRSHAGPVYNPVISARGEPLRLMLADRPDMEVFPDIEADPDGYDIVSWDYRPGDVILFHTNTIHGGAPVPAGGERNTLCLRFIGPDVKFIAKDREDNGNLAVEATQYLWDGLKPGMAVHEGTHFAKMLDRAQAR